MAVLTRPGTRQVTTDIYDDVEGQNSALDSAVSMPTPWLWSAGYRDFHSATRSHPSALPLPNHRDEPDRLLVLAQEA